MKIAKNVIVSLDESDEKELFIPKTVTNIIFYIDEVALHLPYIKKVSVEEGNPVFTVKNGCLIDTPNKTLMIATDNAVIPDDGSVEIIAAYAFHMHSVKSIVIPESVREIGYMAFASLNCKEDMPVPLTVKIPKSVEKIWSRAFFMNGNLTLNTGDNAHYYMEGGCLIERATGKFICALGKDIVVPDCVKTLPACAFLCQEHETITLSANITKIYQDAFKLCGIRDGEGTIVTPCTVYAPKNTYVWRYLVRNKIQRKAV